MRHRGMAPIVGVLALLALVVAAASVVAIGLDGPGSSAPPQFTVDVRYDASATEIWLEHTGGEAVSLHALAFRVTVGGDPLDPQPRYPLSQSEGYNRFGSGAFNRQTSDMFTTGDAGGFYVPPRVRPASWAPGIPLEVELIYDGTVVARDDVVIDDSPA